MNKEDEIQNLDSARSSFSLALRGESLFLVLLPDIVLFLLISNSFIECQERKSRSEALAKMLDNQKTTSSLDLSKKTSVSTNKSSVFPSPGTPTYAMQKGWCSERVALGRSPPNAAFLPLYSGRTVPSKWEDAERWILSPLAREEAARTSFTATRRPKSKSGPLGPPGLAYYSLYSPAVPMVHGGNRGCLTSSSPFSARVLPQNGSATAAAAFTQRTDHCMARSVSIHGCSQTLAPQGIRQRSNLYKRTTFEY